jgi:hypothetical protein
MRPCTSCCTCCERSSLIRRSSERNRKGDSSSWVLAEGDEDSGVGAAVASMRAMKFSTKLSAHKRETP